MYILYDVSPKLSPFVDCYWESNFGGLSGLYEELFVAQFNPNIIINISDAYKRNDSTIKQSSLNTINTSAIKFSHQASNQLFGIRFKPAGLNMFCALGVNELMDASISLKDVFGQEASDLENALLESQNIQERIDIANSFLFKKIIEKNTEKFNFNASVQAQIIKHLNKPNCMTDVIESLNTTHRTLDRNFKQFLGLSPKKLHRLVRFQKVYEALHSPQYKNKTFDFYDYGYYDQAHFSKEFKEFVGLSFQEYLHSPHFVQNLQDNHY